MDSEKCRKCGEVKPLTEEHWHRDSSRTSSWARWCKPCMLRAQAISRATKHTMDSGLYHCYENIKFGDFEKDCLRDQVRRQRRDIVTSMERAI
jgi:hypothetical protein